MAAIEPLRIAVLINTSPSSKTAPFVRASWFNSLRTIEPTCTVDFFDPIDAQEYPDPADYDLIALSGGSTDPRSSEPWVLKMMDFIRSMAASSTTTKLLGICWGHQAIAHALGGRVETMESGPIGDISTITLTPEGQAFLRCPVHKNSFRAPEFHVRWVAEPPATAGFIPLAHGNQAFLGGAGNIFTFQTHPEMDVQTVEAIVSNTALYTVGKTEAEVADVVRRGAEHDGLKVLNKVLQWVTSCERRTSRAGIPQMGMQQAFDSSVVR